jgi:hypothetical protein
MESKIQLTIRTATRDRQANIAAPVDATVGDILASARQNWNLSPNYEYILRCERMGSQLADNQTLTALGILESDVLEIQPLADAG